MNYFLKYFIVKKFSYIIQIYKVYNVTQKFIESSINFNIIILAFILKSSLRLYVRHVLRICIHKNFMLLFSCILNIYKVC